MAFRNLLKLLSFLLLICSLSLKSQQSIALILKNSIANYPLDTEFSVAVIKNNEISYYGFRKGIKDVEKVDNKNALFEIGSLTKVFTAALLAQEVEKGKILLDDNLQKIYKNLDSGVEKITFFQLATHSSGLPRLSPEMLQIANFSNPYQDYDLQKLEKDLTSPVVRPEWIGKYDYSNFGTSVLGFSISKLNHMSYEQLISDRILIPLKMNSSVIYRSKAKGNLVQGLDASGKVTSGWEMNAASPAGGIISSVADMVKFTEFQLKSKEKWVQKMQQNYLDINENLAIGLGWHILKNENVLWHNGGTGGYRSFVAMHHGRNSAVIVLTNVSSMHPKSSEIDQLGITILKQ